MRITDIDGFDAELDASIGESLCGVWQTLVIGVPAEQAAEEAHVAALALVRGRQRAGAIKLDEHVIDFPVH
jgi:hypothetical protein